MANEDSEGVPSSPSGNSSRTTILSDETRSKQLGLSSDNESHSDDRLARERSRSPRARTLISSGESSRKRYQEPPYFWSDTPSHSSPEFEPDPREFDVGRLDIPYNFVSKFPNESQKEVQIWVDKLKNLYEDYRDRHAELVDIMQTLERGMRRMESERKDWLKFKLDNISPMPNVLRDYCRRKKHGGRRRIFFLSFQNLPSQCFLL